MNFGSLIFVRYNSQRVPGKALMDIEGHPSIYWLCRQLQYSHHPYVVCMSTNPLDDAIVDFCERNKILFFRGSEGNVLERMHGAIRQFSLTHAVRITGDDLFVDPDYLEKAIKQYDGSSFCYTDLPKGTDFQIVSSEYIDALLMRNKKEDTEYLTWYFNSTQDKQFLRLSPVGLSTYGFELDTEEDAIRVKFIINNLKHHQYFVLEDLIELARQHEGMFEMKDVVDNRSEEI